MPRRAFISAPPTPISLLGRLHDGTDAEWRRFVDLYGPFVYRLAMRSGLDGHDAEDAAASVVSSLSHRLRQGFKLDPAKGRFRAYVVAATAREVRRLRAARRHRRGIEQSLPNSEAADAPSAEEAAMRLERLERLRVCLRRLSDDRDVRRRDLRAFEDYALLEQPAKKVARRYRLTCQGLYSIKHQMLRRIETTMREMDAELGEV